MSKCSENNLSENFYEFQVALSFANEDRPYVDQVARLLRSYDIKVFYDLFEEATLWGKNLYDYLSDIYKNKAKYTVMFISKNYATKLWTNHERKSMQTRAFQENMEYILPARFDNTPIPGIDDTVLYISLINLSAEKFVKKIIDKLEKSNTISKVKTEYYKIQHNNNHENYKNQNIFLNTDTLNDKQNSEVSTNSKFKIFGGNIGIIGDNARIKNLKLNESTENSTKIDIDMDVVLENIVKLRSDIRSKENQTDEELQILDTIKESIDGINNNNNGKVLLTLKKLSKFRYVNICDNNFSYLAGLFKKLNT
jgi:hypothetical protein